MTLVRTTRCILTHPRTPPQEFQLQDKMLSDLEGKADKTQSKMDATNERCVRLRGLGELTWG